MNAEQRAILSMMDKTFGIDTLQHLEAGQSMIALGKLAAHMGRKVDVVEPDDYTTKYRVKIDGMDVHNGIGGITGFRGWGATAEAAAADYFIKCADTLRENYMLHQKLQPHHKPEDLNHTMGFCLDLDKQKRFDFMTMLGEDIPAQKSPSPAQVSTTKKPAPPTL
jgi:hypothetical protein